MSQANRSYPPNFNLIVQEPGDQFAYNAIVQQPANNNPQQWMQQRSRSVQHNMPSPVNSVVSEMTFPSRRSFDVSSFQQHAAASSNDRSQHDLLGLDTNMLAPSVPGARNRYSPVTRDFSEESWNPLNLRTSDGGSDFHQNNGNMRPYRQGPGSVGNAAPRSDSGFYSQSVMSHDATYMDRSPVQCTPVQQIGDPAATYPTPNASQQMLRVPSDQQSHGSHTSSHSGNSDNPLKCRECGFVSKCRSDEKCVPLFASTVRH